MFLLAILLIAGVLRLVGLGEFGPPGLNQDEAANAWNAYCLLETGQDQAGARWPIFYSRCLGANRSTLYLYVLMPFQAIGGLNAWTTRIPSALGGVVTVLLAYVVATRLFGRNVGLCAAALLALNPWHLQQSRWGHEAALCTLLVMGPLALLLWSNLPFSDDAEEGPRIRIWAAGLAGLLTGVCCYGYPAVRVFLPVFLVAAVAVTWTGWWRRLRTRNGALAAVVLLIAVAVTFGPLAWQHLSDTNATGIAKRSRATWIWGPDASFGEKVSSALARYPRHFGLDFLFVNGDHYEIQSVPGFGQFHWYVLPAMVIGVGVMLRRLWSSKSARVLLVWLLAYPVGDCLSSHAVAGGASMHALRASPGMCSLIILAALGAATAGGRLWQRRRQAAMVVGGVTVVVVLALNVRFLHTFFGDYNHRDKVHHLGYHVHLLEACEWLRPRLDEVDAVFCTTYKMNLPYVVSLVGLGYDPERWFRDERDIRTRGQWDICLRYGKINFMYGGSFQPALRKLQQNGQKDRVLFVVRPGEARRFRFKEPLHQIIGPDGNPVLWICGITL